MTSFLRVNGITVPCMNDDATLDQEDIGSMHRAEDGTPMYNRRAVKRAWTMRTTLQTALTALAFRDLITGKGNVVNFDAQNWFSTKGLGPTEVGAGWTITTSSPLFGVACATSTTAGDALRHRAFTSTSPYTVAYWFKIGGAAWIHYVYRSDGAAWVNGASGFSLGSLPALTITSGIVRFSYAGAVTKLDDLVMLPTFVPDDWPAQMYAWGNAGQPFSALPRLTADGLFIEQNSKISVKGAAGALRARQARSGGSIVPHMQDFAFGLLEV